MTTNPNQQTIDRFWELLDEGSNIFLTGGGGTGKSYLIGQLIEKHQKITAVTASTGIAACNIDGMTVYAWSGMGLGPTANESNKGYWYKLYSTYTGSLRKAAERMEGKKILVIDEISMLNARTLDYLDYHLRQMKLTDKPFGGLQVVVVGDLMQLPPVHKGDEEIDWVFNGRAWKDAKFVMVDLKHTIRQQDEEFAQMLNRIRFGQQTMKDAMDLQMRVLTPSSDQVTRVLGTNAQVDTWNARQLDYVDSPAHIYKADIDGGTSSQQEKLIKNMITPDMLTLKVGAKVMITCNNVLEGYYNGTVGVVRAMHDDTVDVELDDSSVVNVTRHVWYLEPDNKESAHFTQIPIKLAWAITIHKSQGATLKEAHVSASRCFEYGQAYVALSRCTTLQGLTLDGFSMNSLMCSEEASEFYNNPEQYVTVGDPAGLLDEEDEKQMPLITTPYTPTIK